MKRETVTTPNAGNSSVTSPTPMSQLWPLSVTVPPGTEPSSPLITPWPLADANLDYIDIIVPDGHSGQTGVAVYWSGTEILPWGTDQWFICNDEKIHTPINTYITVSGLAVWAYNLGIYEHSFYLRAHVTYTTAPVVTEAPAIGTAAVLGSGTSTYQNTLTPSGIASLTSSPGQTISVPTVTSPVGNLTSLPSTVT